MIFMRDTTPATMRRGIVRRLAQHPVHAEAHAHVAALGLEVDVRGELLDRLGDDRVDELDDRRVVRRLANLGDVGELGLALLDGLRDGLVEPAHAPDQRLDVLRRGDHRLHLVPGHQLQVVERDHVRRVGDGHAQPAALVEADRRGVQPPGRLRADQVERRQVDLEAGQVDVAEPEALRGRARELVDRDRALLEQHLLRRAAGRLALARSPRPRARGLAKPSSAITAGMERETGPALRRGQALDSARSDARPTSSASSSATAGPPGTARSAGPPGSSLIARPRPLG